MKGKRKAVKESDSHSSEALTTRVDVDSDDPRLLAEIVSPHLEGPALKDPELNDRDRPAPVGPEVPHTSSAAASQAKIPARPVVSRVPSMSQNKTWLTTSPA